MQHAPLHHVGHRRMRLGCGELRIECRGCRNEEPPNWQSELHMPPRQRSSSRAAQPPSCRCATRQCPHYPSIQLIPPSTVSAIHMISRHRVLRAVRASGQLDAHVAARPAAPTASRCVASCVLHVCSWPLCYARVYVGGVSQSRLLDDLAWHTMDTASHERSLTIAYHRCRTMPAQLSCFTAFHVAQTHQGHTHSKAIVDTDSVQRNA